MTNEQIDIISQLKRKVDLIIEMNQELKKENNELRVSNKDLNSKLTYQGEQLDELEQKYESLRMAKTIDGGNLDAHSTKIKINRMVREIDKCIALLNR